MRVLFVFPDLSSDKTNYTGIASYGIAVLASQLKREGHEVNLFHMTSLPTEESFREKVGRAGPDLVAFSSNSHYARRLGRWAAWARAETDAAIAIGGVHATLAPQEVSYIPDVQFICVGEGDHALVELCNSLESGRYPTDIENIWARQGESFVKNPVRPFIKNLDELPDPDLSIYDFGNLYSIRRRVFPYIMSRGCAFHCTYCSVPAYERLRPGRGKTWRFMTPGRAATQLEGLIAKYMPDAPLVGFMDSIVFPNRTWLREFATLYRERVRKPFSCNVRADFVTDETAELLHEAGCAVARLGVESGNEDMSVRVLNRQMTSDDIRKAFKILREHAIERTSYNMFGLPGETLDKALDTVRLNAEIDPDASVPFIFYPYPGTRLHDRCSEEGSLTEREFDHYLMDVSTSSSTFARGDILFVHRFFSRLVGLYSVAKDWPPPLRHEWWGFLDWFLASPLLPRRVIVGVRERYRRVRHMAGEYLVKRSPRLYLWLGGTDPL